MDGIKLDCGGPARFRIMEGHPRCDNRDGFCGMTYYPRYTAGTRGWAAVLLRRAWESLGSDPDPDIDMACFCGRMRVTPMTPRETRERAQEERLGAKEFLAAEARHREAGTTWEDGETRQPIR